MGNPLPERSEHVVYVWLDALSNYISALNYGNDHDARFQELWLADVHLIGKEILWFHAVYWPCILLSLGSPSRGRYSPTAGGSAAAGR